MTDIIYLLAPLGFFLLIIIYPFAALASSISKLCSGKAKKLSCWVPIFNIRQIRKELYGKATILTIVCWIVLVFLLCRPLGLLLFSINPALSTLGVILELTALAIWYILMVVTCIDLCIMTHHRGLSLLLCIILAPAVAYVLSSSVPKYFKRHQEEIDGTFDSIEDR